VEVETEAEKPVVWFVQIKDFEYNKILLLKEQKEQTSYHVIRKNMRPPTQH